MTSAVIGVQAAARILELIGSAAYKWPDEIWGSAGTGAALMYIWGGGHEGASLLSKSKAISAGADILNLSANLSNTIASYQRREEEWDFQVELAEIELHQIEKQIAAQEIRQEIVQIDLENYEQQIGQNEKAMDFYRYKFTNKELYSWMVSQISGLYFQSYKMAYDLAKQAEKAYQYELGLAESPDLIQYGYWDNLKKGLLAGERLQQGLRRMELAFLEKNKREYEISKHISLLLLDPDSLTHLKQTGKCFFDIPELIFDIDYPGQYMRRIKSISISIPCVTGPYTSVNAKLTLISNRTRKDTLTSNGYAYNPSVESGFDESFIYQISGTQSIATSSAKGDSGLFELNFRDERYLPFEGAGVISSWKLELPSEFRQFDYDTISDVIIHMNYTAKEGGDAFKGVVNNHVRENINKWKNETAEDQTGISQIN